jgi:hypothetical protein
MSLNARMSASDPRLYNPNRDVAHNFDFVITAVASAIESGRWDAPLAIARAKGITDEELGAACSALCRFVTVQVDDPKESMYSCLVRSGFLDLKPEARVIVMAYLGNVILGMHWAGVREATLGGSGPAQTYQHLREHGDRLVRLMGRPRWRRALSRWWYRIKRAWRIFRSHDEFEGRKA